MISTPLMGITEIYQRQRNLERRGMLVEDINDVHEPGAADDKSAKSE